MDQKHPPANSAVATRCSRSARSPPTGAGSATPSVNPTRIRLFTAFSLSPSALIRPEGLDWMGDPTVRCTRRPQPRKERGSARPARVAGRGAVSLWFTRSRGRERSPFRRSSMRLTRNALAVATGIPSLAAGQSGTISIHAGTVLDGRGGVTHNTAIVVEGSRIVRLDPAANPVSYDLRGLTVMPGGIDTHVHLTSHFDPNGRAHNDPGGTEPLQRTILYAEENAYRALMAGITTVQSIGATLDRDLRDAIARGTIPGPRVITSLDWITPEAGDADGLRRAVRQRVADGADVIKILGSKSIREGGGPTLSEDQLRAACGEARAQGRRSVVHAHAAEAARRAVLAGATSIEHGVLLDEATLDLMADHGTFFDPNLYLVFQNYFDNKARFLGMENYTEEARFVVE